MEQLFPYFLFLHVFGAILAFGPTFAFSIMGAMAGKEPQHANFSARQSAAISQRLTYPLAILQGITGVLLIISGKLDLMSRTWLIVAIVLYLIALVYALTIQRNALHKVIELSSGPPRGGGAPGGPATAGAPVGGPSMAAAGPGSPAMAGAPVGGPPMGAPAGGPPMASAGGPPAGARPGPPPELLAAVKLVQRGGMLLGLLIITIVFLMVVKPSF